MADKIHSVRKTLRLKPAEAMILAQRAHALNLTEAEYLRLLLSQKPCDYPEIREEVRQLISAVNRIGVNINQIVHHHNYELYSQTDRELLTAYMKKLREEVQEVVRQIGY